jgi:molybdopterin-containing oxidoreductase family iron-sulfur binding subunit
MAGFSIAATTIGGCQRAPVQYAVARLSSSEGITPGRSYHYATTCGGCSAGCGLLVKNRDGRPIKLEGNPDHPLSHGGLCAAGQASLLGLYDVERLSHPLQDGQPAQWPDVDKAIVAQLETIRKEKRPVRFVTGPIVSPTTRALIERFLGSFADARHVVHDSRSCSAILDAHAKTHGQHVLPHYQLDKAQVIVSFAADFLGTWISPVEFTAAYQAGRRDLDKATPRLSYHVQFESKLTLTGSKADRRLTVTPEEISAALQQLAARIAKKASVPFPGSGNDHSTVSGEFLDQLADQLWQNRQRSLILCGSQNVSQQVLVNFLNHTLGNYGTTVDIAQNSYQRDDNDGQLQTLLRELKEGRIAALVVHQCNPVHDLPDGEQIADDLKRVPLFVSLDARLDETARLARFACPDHHYLESWSDAEPVNGCVSLVQPAISPIGNTRSVMESLSAWLGKPRLAYEILREHWEADIFPRVSQRTSFQEFWDRTLHDGFAKVNPRPGKTAAFNTSTVSSLPAANKSPEGTLSLILYSKVGMPAANHAYNAWLQELPDPISKVTWDNYACLSPATASRFGVSDGDVVRIESAGAGGSTVTLELPAFVQPGQHDQVVAVALGYGSVLSKRFSNTGPPWLQARPTVGPDGMVGKNAAPLLTWVDGVLSFVREGVRISKTGSQYPLASTQSYYQVKAPQHLIVPGHEPQPIIREFTLAEFAKNGKAAGAHAPAKPAEAEMTDGHDDLWPDDHPMAGAHYGMSIDMNACTGCSACVVACQAENNIPVVGKDEVQRKREMHWLRIDRYYEERDGGVDVVHQPMLCQQCGNAPCEVVCPVLATVHSDEGLNEQVYNRCVGTRYCANNCPYKVRRFNWFDYAHDDLLHNLVFNPDVTMRSRGVMEKCTFCVQRIQEAKIEAKRKGQPVGDGDIQTACQQSCPAQAIAFGNLNDPKSRVTQAAAGRRSYRVLEELNIRPSVNYLAVVRNRQSNEGGMNRG